MAVSNLPRADRLLVKQCRADDPAAWELLYARLQQRARELLPKALGQDAANKGLMDELTVDTLAELFLNKGQLDACYHSWQNLDEFLAYLLNRAVLRYRQTRARRRRREKLFSHPRLTSLVAFIPLHSIQPDFVEHLVERLTPAEKKYLDWLQLSQQEAAPPCPYKDSYARKLKSSIRKKARHLRAAD